MSNINIFLTGEKSVKVLGNSVPATIYKHGDYEIEYVNVKVEKAATTILKDIIKGFGVKTEDIVASTPEADFNENSAFRLEQIYYLKKIDKGQTSESILPQEYAIKLAYEKDGFKSELKIWNTINQKILEETGIFPKQQILKYARAIFKI
jgi:hypothetical protein